MRESVAGDVSGDNVDREIGGYFGLELPDYGDPFAAFTKFQSARAAFRALLEAIGAKRVFMPAYICSSMIKSANDAGCQVVTYHLDEGLYPRDLERKWQDDEYLIYVNYFGLADRNVQRLVDEIPPGRLIMDNSQGLFSRFDRVLASVYSPRKFAGLPDGGLLWSSGTIASHPVAEDRGSADRMRYLITRVAFSARDGYAEFNAARRSLTENAPLRMSRLTRRILRAIPWEDVRTARRKNYRRMDEMLAEQNSFSLRLQSDEPAPLCYPFWTRGRDLTKTRTRLAYEGIFIPTYWEDALPRTRRNSIETALVREALFLPIDQRMGFEQVEFVAERVLRLLG